MIVINWAPTPTEEVLQNVNTLLATEVGSVPLARDLGTPQDVVDSPMSLAGAKLQASIIKAVRTYEPRVKVESVTLSGDVDGKLRAAVKVGPP